jgi:hypothetical protein
MTEIVAAATDWYIAREAFLACPTVLDGNTKQPRLLHPELLDALAQAEDQLFQAVKRSLP